jgi:CHASE2 domain-containing sensor protein
MTAIKTFLRGFFKPKPSPSKKFRFIFFLINLMLATAVVVILHHTEDLVIFKEIKDTSLDWIMYWHSDFEPKPRMQRMALFEIDDTTYRSWDSPVITPRDKLKGLIEAAEQGGANVIAVDILLSWFSDGCLHQANQSSHCPIADATADQMLADYLHSINESEAAETPIIILTRLYRLPLENGQLNDDAFLTKPPSFLDQVLKEEKNVFWASTFMVVDDDNMRRRWQLAPLVCQDNHLTVVPSMQLLVALAQLYATDDSTRRAAQVIRDFKTQWNEWASQFPCDPSQGTTLMQLCQYQACPQLSIELPKKVGVSSQSHRVDLAGGRHTEKIIYRFAPPDNPDQMQRSFIDIKSAKNVLEEEVDVDNQIALIGVTHSESSDYHPVPIRLEEVSGIYILANAIDTLLRFGQLKQQPFTKQVIVSTILIIITTLIFTYYDIAKASLFCSLLFALLILLGMEAMHHGIEIDVALRLLTIQFTEFILRFFGFWEFLQQKLS